ncbi:hypothetical protein [Psychrobacter sp. 16-MNA-CIBAN-0192]|uniref:hypothetical protein n=1 Tax=Psychrobacter sp. 16-MNA-CIBAN-0192 TaxID=3140448 RepID=UPI003333A456
MSRLPKTYDGNTFYPIVQDLMDYEEFSLGKLSIDLEVKDRKYEHKIREQFNLRLNQIDVHSAKILLRIEDFLVNGSWNKINYDDVDYINLLHLYLNKYKDPLQRFNDLIKYKNDKLLPDYYIKWFGNNLRRSLFLASLFEDAFEGKTYQGELELLEAVSDYLRYFPRRFNHQYELPIYQLVSVIDPEEANRSRNIEFVKTTYFDNHVSNQDIKWIISSDFDQIDWAYDYLEKEKRREKEKQSKKDGYIADNGDEKKQNKEDGDTESYIPLKRVFFPQTTQEKYELILASIDRIPNVENPPFLTNLASSYSERGYVLNKMQNAWRSRKEPSDKVLSSNEVTVKLSKKSRDTLNKLPGNSKAEIDKFINKCIEEYVKKPS